MEKIKVIIVDDEQIILNGLTAMLDWGRLGFEVVATAINGRQGICRFQEFSPQVVFSDIRMPVMDGLDMLKAIRIENTFARFIILSAFGEFVYAKRAMELGANAYILKEELNPASLSALLDQIRREIESQSKSTYEAIIETIISFVQIGNLSFDNAVVKIESYFSQFIDLQEAYGLESLKKNVDAIFNKAFEQYGKSIFYYTSTAALSRDALRQWIVEQMRRVNGWRFEEKSRMTPAISNAVFFLRENYSNKELSIGMVSERVGISVGRLSVLFKQETGKTMTEYIKILRIERAKSLLRQGQYRVYEIAEKVGFTSAEYFSRVFTKVVGSPPQYYMKG